MEEKKSWFQKNKWSVFVILILIVVIAILVFSGFKPSLGFFVFVSLIVLAVIIYFIFQYKFKYKNLAQVINEVVAHEYKYFHHLPDRYFENGEPAVLGEERNGEYHIKFLKDNLYYIWDPFYGVKARLVTTFEDKKEERQRDLLTKEILKERVKKQMEEYIKEKSED